MTRRCAGSRPLAATYYVAPSQHLGLEPLTATARVQRRPARSLGGDPGARAARARAEQLPAAAGDALSDAGRRAGRPRAGSRRDPDRGRAGARDSGARSSSACRNRRARTTITRRAGALARMTALPGAGGITAAWKMRVATGRRLRLGARRGSAATSRRRSSGEAALDGSVPPYSIPHVSDRSASPCRSPFEAGYMRGSPAARVRLLHRKLHRRAGARRGHGAAGVPDVAARRQSAARALPPGRGAARRNGTAAGAAARWASPAARPSARTSGWSPTRPSATTSGSRSTGWSPRSIAAASINPGLVDAADRRRADLGAGPGDRPGARMGRRNAARAAARRARPAADRRHARDRRRSSFRATAPPGGVSGLGTTVLAPAVANAIYAGTGKRMRALPFDPMARMTARPSRSRRGSASC